MVKFKKNFLKVGISVVSVIGNVGLYNYGVEKGC